MGAAQSATVAAHAARDRLSARVCADVCVIVAARMRARIRVFFLCMYVPGEVAAAAAGIAPERNGTVLQRVRASDEAAAGELRRHKGVRTRGHRTRGPGGKDNRHTVHGCRSAWLWASLEAVNGKHIFTGKFHVAIILPPPLPWALWLDAGCLFFVSFVARSCSARTEPGQGG